MSLFNWRKRKTNNSNRSSPKDDRQNIGVKGERIAEKYLKRKGFRFAARNLRKKAGEIDLLMIDKDELVIVEVRTITSEGEIALDERVPYRKRKQLVRLANYLIAELPDPLPPVRFDVCIVVMKPKLKVVHFEDAFRSDDFKFKHR